MQKEVNQALPQAVKEVYYELDEWTRKLKEQKQLQINLNERLKQDKDDLNDSGGDMDNSRELKDKQKAKKKQSQKEDVFSIMQTNRRLSKMLKNQDDADYFSQFLLQNNNANNLRFQLKEKNSDSENGSSSSSSSSLSP